MSQTSMFCFSDSEISEDSTEDNETFPLTSASGSHLQIPGFRISPKVRTENAIKQYRVILVCCRNDQNLFTEQPNFIYCVFLYIFLYMVDHKSVLLFSRAVPAAFLLVSTSHNGQNLCYLIELVTRLNSYSCRAFFKKYGTIHYTGHSRHSQSV